jgi:uncharacterized protein YjbJ (UPF0337 family)
MQEATSDDVKGRAKEAAGSLLDDDRLKREGRAEQLAGKLKRKAGEAIDAVKELLIARDEKAKKNDENS